MTTKKVDLVHYVKGVRKVIGEAVVDVEDNYLDVSAKVTDPEYIKTLTGDLNHVSLGYTTRDGCFTEYSKKVKKGQK